MDKTLPAWVVFGASGHMRKPFRRAVNSRVIKVIAGPCSCRILMIGGKGYLALIAVMMGIASGKDCDGGRTHG